MASIEITQIRELTDLEIPQLNQLVSTSFGYEAPHSFMDDFPIWKSGLVKRYGIFSGEQLISHAGIRFCEMQTSAGLVPMAMIGAVATDENFRGQGLSSRILVELCRISEEHGSHWTLLWGSEHDFYRKFGFELHGEQYQAPLSELAHIPENEIPRVKRGWDDRIFDFLFADQKGIKLQNQDREWLTNHSTVSWFVQESPFAFIGYERGMDLPHIIHEFGGDRKGIKLLFSFILSLDSEASVLGTRQHLESLGFLNDAMIEEYLCLARPHSKMPELVWNEEFWVQGLSAC